MIEQEQNKQFDFDDIQRYLSGAMSSAERNELERAALQDPFLSDAIDGFELQGTESFVKHQYDITNAILQKQGKATVVDLPAKNQWLRIAALFVLIAGVGLIGYQFFKPGITEQVAIKQATVKEKPVETQQQQSENIAVADSQTLNVPVENHSLSHKTEPDAIKLINKESSNDLLIDEEADPVIAVAGTPVIATEDKKVETLTPGRLDDIKNDTTFSAKPALSVEQVLQGKAAGLQIQTEDKAELGNSKSADAVLQQGVVTDSKGNPLPNVNVISSDRKSTTLTDMFGRFSLVNNDTTKSVTVAAVGYTSKQVSLNGDADYNTIVLEPVASSLSEVVVTSIVMSRKNKELNYATEKITPATQPVGGWESFHEYVRKQLGIDSITYYGEYPWQEVTVEFNLDKDGKAYDVKILQAEDREKAAAIRRIIESGPRWTNPEKRKKIRITIPF